MKTVRIFVYYIVKRVRFVKFRDKIYKDSTKRRYIYIYIYIYIYMCVYLCVTETETDRQTDRQRCIKK